MSRLTANVGEELRAELDAYAARRGCSISDALRAVLVLGLGGSIEEAHKLNEQMAQRRLDRLDALAEGGVVVSPLSGVGELPAASRALVAGHDRMASGAPKTWVHVRVPHVLARRVKAAGGVKPVLSCGLERGH